MKIQNERQREVTLAQRNDLLNAIDDIVQSADDVDSGSNRLTISSLIGQVRELNAQLDDYDRSQHDPLT